MAPDAGHPVDAVLFLHVAEGVPAGEAGAQAQFHDFLGVEAGTGTAAEGFFPDGVRGHFHELGADGAQHGAGLFEQAHGAGGLQESWKVMMMPVLRSGRRFSLLW